MDGYVTIGTKLDTKTFDRQIDEVKDKIFLIEQRLSKRKELGLRETEVAKLNTELEKLNNKLITLNREQAKASKMDFSGVKKNMTDIGNSIEGVVKKVVKWGLAVFSIRSAYSLVRQAISTISGYNQQIGTDIEYMRFALATALQPIIERIIDLAHKLLVYTAYIAKAWFGVNIFANATAEAFKNANKSVKSTNKSARELKKTLAGFDEMNILQQDGSTALGGGGGGISAPSIDLSEWDNIEIPKWIQWIANNKDLILGFLKQLAIALVAFKIAEWLVSLAQMFKLLEGFGNLKIFGLTASIATILIGLYQTVMGIIAFVKDPSWENFDKILHGLETILIGVGIALVTFNAASPIGWIMIAVGLISQFIGGLEGLSVAADIAGLALIAFNAASPVGWVVMAAGAIGGLISALFGEEEQTKRAKKAQEEYTKAKEKAKLANDAYVSAVDNADQSEKKLNDTVKKHKISTEQLNDIVKRGEQNYKQLSSTEREVYKAYIENESAQERLKDATKELTKARKEEAKEDIEQQLSKAKTKDSYDKLRTSVIDYYKQGKLSAKETMDYLDQAMKQMGKKSASVFLEEIPNDIKEAFGTDKYKGEWNKFSSWFNNNVSKLNISYVYTIETKFRTTGGYQTSGQLKRAKGGIFYPSKLPKLAVGGIINKPGTGVPYNGAIIGERGAEAVVPLTDNQQMALLGEAIGKYITINANITNTMNGRVIGRELQRLNNESDFAYNR